MLLPFLTVLVTGGTSAELNAQSFNFYGFGSFVI